MVAERLTAQLLAGPPARDPVAVAERLLAIQAQDPRGARLAIRARTSGLTAADVDRAFTDDRSLVITWLNRRTLHLVRSEDYAWLHALTAPRQLTATLRRLAQEGVRPTHAERGVDAIERALADDGPLVRDQLAERVAAARVRVKGQAFLHLLVLASIRGIAVRGPMVGRQQAYVLVRDWLGKTAPVKRDAALAELGRRYVAGHAPADERDLAYWSGLPLRDARAAVAACRPRRRRAGEAPPRLLGPYDPVLHGWASREPLLGRHDAAIVTGGIFRPFALVGGKPVGTWRLSQGRVELQPFERLSRAAASALAAEAADVERFLAAQDT
jgi:hypothetical protein